LALLGLTCVTMFWCFSWVSCPSWPIDCLKFFSFNCCPWHHHYPMMLLPLPCLDFFVLFWPPLLLLLLPPPPLSTHPRHRFSLARIVTAALWWQLFQPLPTISLSGTKLLTAVDVATASCLDAVKERHCCCRHFHCEIPWCCFIIPLSFASWAALLFYWLIVAYYLSLSLLWLITNIIILIIASSLWFADEYTEKQNL